MSREEIEGLGSLLEDAADALRYEDWPFAATSVEKAAQALTTLLAENERLREALREAAPYVPEHHGPVRHKIAAALNKDPAQ